MAHRWSWTFGLIIAIVSVFQTCRCETLRYSNCSEVQAADSVVIEAVGYPFFCSDVTYLGYKSCAEILQAGHQETGYYEIDPDGADTGVASFLVFCDMCKITSVISECPVDYLTFENSCYKIYTSTASRDGASSTCTAANSHLVDITSQEEQYFLAGKLNSQGSGDAWIGLSSQNNDDPLYWTDDSPLDFEAWDSYGRNDGGTCIRMNDGSNYRWGDKECSTNYRFVCEFELSSSSPEFTDCKGRTVIDHEQPRTGTDNLLSKNKPGETQMPITYKPSLSQITALIAVSQSCQQYIKYDCRNSKIWDIGNGWPYVWWKSRHGKDMHNFGGVPTGQEGCACSLTVEGCTTSGTKCNCDTEDGSSYSDDGLLSDKETLPVTKLRFGGNDASNYVLRPLECDGIQSSPKRSCDELWLTGERTDMEYDIDPDGADGLGPAFKVFCKLSEAAPILRSCKELRLAGYDTNGYYDIDPDEPNFGEPAFTVFCNMSDTGESIIHHDSESRGRVKGYKDKGDFVLTPNYLASSVEQMYRLIGVSEHCQQYIQYDCSKSKMWKGTSTDKAEAWWSTKDGGMMLNWGGVDTGKYGCSCYMNTECFNTGKVCNCDDDNIQWMTDGGQLDDKDSLPVYKVYHAHTENDERAGWHTLGPLLCSGMTNDLPMYRTCAELQRAGHVRNGSYLLDSDGPDAGDPPFVAYCDITNGKTYIFHDLPDATDVKQGTDYNRVVNYAPSNDQLKELASLSAECGQELRFDCNYFPLWDTNLGEMKGWWLNIDGQKMNNWAGAALEDVGCKCADEQCPVDYLTFDNSCYKIYTSTVSRDDASSTCTAANSHLVDITSQQEQDFLVGQLNSHNIQGSGNAWIGLSSQNTNDPLYWTDGSPLDFEAWDSSGRESGGTCIRMRANSNYRWRDKSCSTNFRFVCVRV
ncbi:uncharacterized protein [Amphiura filiformis]|uniref:uncharacterized protein isoform X1 n=1 Tax=Amphiura filiformis TaxID=82378 RepID=UPI003B22533E